MRKYLAILLFASMAVACNQEEMNKLNQQKEELAQESTAKDSTINDLMATFNEIQDNLDEIKRRENLVDINTDNDAERSLGKTEKINRDIQRINQLLLENKKLIETLNEKSKSSAVKSGELNRMIANLNKRIKDKDTEIATLREDLEKMNFKVVELNSTIDELAIENMKKNKDLEQSIAEKNTAYFAYGTYDELNSKNVLTKEGGFLGIGKQKTLKNNFNTEYFSVIDKYKTKSFLIYSKEAKLVTNHPEGSYEFKGTDDQVDSLVITNPDEFWRTSKYMVVLVD